MNSTKIKNSKFINDKFHFDYSLENKIVFSEELYSKNQLDNFDFNKHIKLQLFDDLDYYKILITKYKNNNKDYLKYVQEINNLENTEKNRVDESLLSYEDYIKYEDMFCKKCELKKPACDFSVEYNISYTSPSGRNYYDKKNEYSYNQFLTYINICEKEEKLTENLKIEKERQAQKKREKEKRLRELDKFENTLAQKEIEIKYKEAEFIKATKGHIYTNEEKVLEPKVINDEKPKTLSQKLKDLRTTFDNGLITYEEYQKQRKELV